MAWRSFPQGLFHQLAVLAGPKASLGGCRLSATRLPCVTLSPCELGGGLGGEGAAGARCARCSGQALTG